MEQHIDKYTDEDLLVWSTLFKRQVENLNTKGSEYYLNCLENMKDILNADEIADFSKVNDWFKTSTGWEIEVVPGLIEVDKFFHLLAEKKFCSSTWLRSFENLDYLEEPDMFHDTFGHIPILSDPLFSTFAHEFGKIGKKFSHNAQALVELQRLYWFTIEFGVIRQSGAIKVYGAGIISSYGETNRIANKECEFLEFDIHEILAKYFRNDVMQDEYFVIDSFDQLNDSLDVVRERFASI
ncbi:phenylalanine-4-hydroxylase [Crocinitomix catalasitica]|nr:phenylalanine-4-hydroxylase [Crocinitomix catalasitica]